LLVFSAGMARAEEPEKDPLKVFTEDLCNEEAVRVMALEMAEFIAVAGYDEKIASTGVSVEEFIDQVVAEMDKHMKEQEFEFTYCNVDEASKVDCDAAAKLIEASGNFKYEKIMGAMEYLGIGECAAVLYTLQVKGEEAKSQSIAIAGNTDNFWRLITVVEAPPEQVEE
jgi:hypothetical protein